MFSLSRLLAGAVMITASATPIAETITLLNGDKKSGQIDGYSGNFARLYHNDHFDLLELTDIETVSIDQDAQGSEFEEQRSRVEILRRLMNVQERVSERHEKTAQEYLESGDFKNLEASFQLIMSDNARFADGTWHIDTYFDGMTRNAIGSGSNQFKNRIQIVDQWLEKHPGSSAAITAKIRLLVAAAWAERGRSISSAVTKEQHSKFKSLLEQAIDLGRGSLQSKQPPHFYFIMVRAGKGYGVDVDELLNWANESGTYYPDYMNTFVELASAMLPKWGGELKNASMNCHHAAEYGGKADADEHYYRCVAAVSGDINDREISYYEFDWPRVKRGFEDFVDRYDETESHIHHMAQLAAHHFQHDDAKSYFERTSGEWNHHAAKVWEKQTTYERYLEWSYSEKEQKVIDAIIAAIKRTKYTVALDLYDQYKGRADQLNKLNLFGESIMHLAADAGAIEILELILDVGGDVNVLDGYGRTPLYYAMFQNEIDAVAVLLARGADPMIEVNGATVVHLAARQGYLEILKQLVNHTPGVLLKKNKRSRIPLHYAIRTAQYETVDYMLKQKEILAFLKKDDSDWPVLVFATYHGRDKLVRDLVTAGAAINVFNKNGESALTVAERLEFPQLVNYLRSLGLSTDTNTSNTQQVTLARQLYKKAMLAKEKWRYDEARELLLRALEEYPEYDAARSALAYQASQLGDDEEAVRQIDYAIQINPEENEYIYWKGRYYHNLGQPEQYRPLFQKYVALVPNSRNAIDLKVNFPHYLDRFYYHKRFLSLSIVAMLIASLVYIRRQRRSQS